MSIAMKSSLFLVAALLIVLQWPTQVVAGICDASETGKLGTDCVNIYESLETSLLSDKGNLYRMRKIFFSSPNEEPVLLKVNVNLRLTFGENISFYETCFCDSEDSSPSFTNSSSTNHTNMIYFWTASAWCAHCYCTNAIKYNANAATFSCTSIDSYNCG